MRPSERVLAAARRRTRAVAGLALGAGLPLAACVQTVAPRLTPARVPSVQPPISARAVVLITPGFAGQTGASDHDGPPVPTGNVYRLGAAAESLVVAWARASFREVEVRPLPEAGALRLLVTGDGAPPGAVLLLPRFEGRLGEPYEGNRFAVRLRLDARALRTGGVWSWAGAGRGRGGFFGSAGLASGRALEAAVAALADSVAARRDSL